MGSEFQDGQFLEVTKFFAPKIFFALFCGGIVGLERELTNKSAGIKTNMLICVGSAMYAAVSVLISKTHAEMGYYGDPARLVAQVVSGIGFLGGGAIIQAQGTVVGMTTAATIWVVAAIGICVGLGYTHAAVGTALTVVFVLTLIRFLERRFISKSNIFTTNILAEDNQGQVRQFVQQMLDQNQLNVEDFEFGKKGTLTVLSIEYRGSFPDHKKFISTLWRIPGVREVKSRN